MYSWHEEKHKSQRSGWLRAGVLGANDGVISVGSLLMGVASAAPSQHTIMLTGIAATVAGAISMAAGEYVSVSSQSDTERADIAKESVELKRNPHHELRELTYIYIQRGLSQETAKQVAIELTEHDALGAHLRDEIGLTEITQSQPVLAASTSATAFISGAILPLLIAIFAPSSVKVILLTIVCLLELAVLGCVSSKLGGAPVVKGLCRVLIWGAFSLAISSAIGHLFGVGG